MTALARKVAFRAEHTGSAGQDRAQRQAQAVSAAHEQTKSIVAALMNRAYVELAADTTIATSGSYSALISTTITTVLATGNLDIIFTTSGTHPTNVGTVLFRVLVDGVVADGCYVSVPAGYAFSTSMVLRVAVSRGLHTVAVVWRTDANSARIRPVAQANDEHANMLVQEAL